MAQFWTCKKCGTNIGTDYDKCPMCEVPRVEEDENLNGYAYLIEAVISQFREDILSHQKDREYLPTLYSVLEERIAKRETECTKLSKEIIKINKLKRISEKRLKEKKKIYAKIRKQSKRIKEDENKLKSLPLRIMGNNEWMEKEKRRIIGGKYDGLFNIYAGAWSFDFQKILNGFIKMVNAV